MLRCGIDEAGRGPLIGPLVMAGVVLDEAGCNELRNVGVKDSKLLTAVRREALYPRIIQVAKRYSLKIVEPAEIDAAILSETLNLNWLEAHTSAAIINELRPDAAMVDCPSVNIKHYSSYLRALLSDKTVKLSVEHKADANHIECAAASILAKVTRDAQIETIKKRVGDFGSGYLSDPKTVQFLEAHYATYPDVFRKTWAPYRLKAEALAQKTLNNF